MKDKRHCSLIYPLLLISFICFQFHANAQETEESGKDEFHHIEYYPDGVIKLKGNLEEGEEIGLWFFYKPDGSLLAKGKFVKGTAKGKWVYHNYEGKRRTYNWNWAKGFGPGTRLEIREGKLYILQSYAFSNGVFRSFENGEFVIGGKF